MNEILKHLPQQWVGFAALILFGLYVLTQAIEKYEKLANILPFGAWWHERQRRRRQLDNAELTNAIETARKSWINDENAALTALERRMASIAKTSENQASDIRELQTTVRAFTAWSSYDARWHHKLIVENSERSACEVPAHRDFFEFEHLWRTDPFAAAQL